MKGRHQEEVGDLFVTEHSLTLKLLPSKKSASMNIEWFEDGRVTNHRAAVRDISAIVEKIKGKTRVVRGLTLMTDRGTTYDITASGLPEAVHKAGFTPIN